MLVSKRKKKKKGEGSSKALTGLKNITESQSQFL